MASAMGVGPQSIVELRDAGATKLNIVTELEKLRARVQSGDRVFIYYSGHGTRYNAKGRCVEGLQTYSAGPFTEEDVLSEEDLARYTQPLSEKADKIITLMDSCFSGGVLASKTRSLANDLGIRPRYNATASDCSVAVNDRATRGLAPALIKLGVAKENFVQIAAANYNEVSWDFPQLGGLVTHSLTQCLLGEARDLDQSGAVSLDEVRECAQKKVDDAMRPHTKYGRFSSTIQVRGSRNLIVVQDHVPSVPAIETIQPSATEHTGISEAARTEISIPPPPSSLTLEEPPRTALVPGKNEKTEKMTSTPLESAENQYFEAGTTPDVAASKAVASLATLRDIYEQRNGRLKIEINAPTQLKIGKDKLKASIVSNSDGYLYAVMLGSDAQSFYLLFPNRLDQDNKIKANTPFSLPRPGWSITSGGPEGINHVLFVLSQSPRNPEIFPAENNSSGGPFTFALSDLTSRQRLIDFFIGKGIQGGNGQMGASLISIKEIR